MKPHTRWTLSRSAQGLSLIEALAKHMNVSGRQAKRWLDARCVFVNRRRVWMARHRLHAGDEIEVQAAVLPSGTQSARSPALLILAQGPAWLAVDKPAGRLTNGPDSIETQLRTQCREPELEVVHRLDRDTTGCLLCARTRAVRAELVTLFEERRIRKEYVALVHGAFPAKPTQVDKPLDHLPALTEFRLLDRNARASLVSALPRTGRTHQIRLHLRALGHPLAGDRVYATGEVEDTAMRQLPRQMLHAWRLSWTTAGGEPIRVEAPWPADLRRAARAMGLSDQPPR